MEPAKWGLFLYKSISYLKNFREHISFTDSVFSAYIKTANMYSFNINRRRFLKTSAASLALSMLGPAGLESVFQSQPRRVGLIGSGWYGKSDLFRLIQVTPVEVVAVCDVDKNHRTAAAELISKRQKSGNTPKTYEDYQTMLQNHEFDIILIGTPDH